MEIRMTTENGREHYTAQLTYAQFIDEVRNGVTDTARNVEDSALAGTYEFTGTNSFQDAIRLHENGYAFAFSKLNLPELVTAQATMNIYNDVVGAVPNIGEYLSGNPENMMRFEVEQAPKKGKIHLVFNAIYSGAIPQHTAMAYGAAIIDICNALSNYDVKITAVWHSACNGSEYNKSHKATISIVIKDWHEPYIQNKILSFGHSSFLRRLIFRLQEIHGELYSYGYGQVLEIPKDMFKDDPYAILFPMLEYRDKREDLKEKMLKRINKFHEKQKELQNH